MLEGNFIIHQWCTNSPLLHKELQESNTSTQSSMVLIFGLSWDTQTGTISFPVQNFNSTNTQTNLLNAKCLAWQGKYMTLLACYHRSRLSLIYLLLNCGRQTLAGINPCPPVLQHKGTQVKSRWTPHHISNFPIGCTLIKLNPFLFTSLLMPANLH